MNQSIVELLGNLAIKTKFAIEEANRHAQALIVVQRDLEEHRRKWVDVSKINLEVGRAYVIRRVTYISLNRRGKLADSRPPVVACWEHQWSVLVGDLPSSGATLDSIQVLS